MDSLAVQLILEFFGAFLGFLFAALLAGLMEKNSQKKKYRMILNSLAEELNDIVVPIRQSVEVLTERLSEKYQKDEHDSNLSLEEYIDSQVIASAMRIPVPTWDTLQHSGLLLELIDKNYFETLIRVYSLIKVYNEDLLYHAEITVKQLKGIVAACDTALRSIQTER